MLTAVSLATMSIVTHSLYPPPVSPVDVAVEKVYYRNGLLRANISWRFNEGMYDLLVVKVFCLLNMVIFCFV